MCLCPIEGLGQGKSLADMMQEHLSKDRPLPKSVLTLACSHVSLYIIMRLSD
jgi:hypothetical protein